MERVKIKLYKPQDYSYDIVIGYDLFHTIADDLKKYPIAGNIVIITDSHVLPLYGEKLLSILKGEGFHTNIISFPAGEENKNRKTKELIEDQMFELGLGRDTLVLTLGGGVVGDLAGFVSATYNRGIPYIHIPTTIISQVDSSIGGKTAIDTPYGKNLLGAFYQPKKVYIDTKTLDTLPKREYITGMAEIIKHAIIMDAELFSFLEDNAKDIIHGDKEKLCYLIKRNCEIKGKVIEEDEKEADLRKILNFGHTIGHAIETLCSYNILHGEAISVGMNVEAMISHYSGILNQMDLVRIKKILHKYNLPTTLSRRVFSNILPYRGDELIERLIEITRWDKKGRYGKIQYVLPNCIGEMRIFEESYSVTIEDEVVKQALIKVM